MQALIAPLTELAAGKGVEQQIQKPSRHGTAVSAFISIAVHHPHCQRRQQIGTGNRQQSGKSHMGNGQDIFQDQIGKKGKPVHHKQPDIALDPAVPPDLLIDPSDKPGRENTHNRQQ